MTEPSPDERPGPPSVPDAAQEATPDDPAAAAGQNVERRAFLRHLTGEAVVTTARVAGLTAVFRRSLLAAGEAVARDLEPDAVVEPAGAATVPELPPARPAGVPAVPTSPLPEPVVVTLTPRQEALLERATSAVLAVNDPAGPPHLTASAFHWDGAVLRLPSELLSARVTRIDADPRVSVLVEEEASGGWVALTGVASITAGDAVEPAMLTILGRQLSDDEAERRWAELRSIGDPVVIEVRPIRFLWRLE